MPLRPNESSYITAIGQWSVPLQITPAQQYFGPAVIGGFGFPNYTPNYGNKQLELKSMLRYLKEDRQAYLLLVSESAKGDNSLPSTSSTAF